MFTSVAPSFRSSLVAAKTSGVAAAETPRAASTRVIADEEEIGLTDAMSNTPEAIRI